MTDPGRADGGGRLGSAGAAAGFEALLIRHGEKTGRRGDAGLSSAGARRARRLAEVLPALYGSPEILVAAADTPKSARPRLTLEPLADRLGLSVLTTWRTEDVVALAEALRADPALRGRRALISWRHEALPALARALGAQDPPPWPASLYGALWRVTGAPGEAALEALTDGVGEAGDD